MGGHGEERNEAGASGRRSQGDFGNEEEEQRAKSKSKSQEQEHE
jgi:hypothetical protein